MPPRESTLSRMYLIKNTIYPAPRATKNRPLFAAGVRSAIRPSRPEHLHARPASLLLCLIGLVPVVLLKGQVRPILTSALGNHWGKLLFSVIHVFWFITLYPLILKLLGRTMKLDFPEAPKG